MVFIVTEKVGNYGVYILSGPSVPVMPWEGS